MQTVKVVRKAHITIFLLLLGIVTSSCEPQETAIVKEVTRIVTQTDTPTPNITLTHSPTATNTSTATNTAVPTPSRMTINWFSLAVPEGWSIIDEGRSYPILASPEIDGVTATTIAFFDGPSCKYFYSLSTCVRGQMGPQGGLTYVLEGYTGAFSQMKILKSRENFGIQTYWGIHFLIETNQGYKKSKYRIWFYPKEYRCLIAIETLSASNTTSRYDETYLKSLKAIESIRNHEPNISISDTPYTPKPIPTSTSIPTITSTPASCLSSQIQVIVSSANVRTGPGAGRPGEKMYEIQSYLKRGECLNSIATNPARSWVKISGAARTEANQGWIAAELLAFGADHPSLASLPIIAEIEPKTPQSPDEPNPALTPVGIGHLGGANHVCYDIQGSDVYQLAAEMEAKGPFCESCNSQRAWGMTTYSFPFKYSCSPVTKTYNSLSVSFNYTITMPCWYPQSGTKPDQIAEFDKFMQILAVHELRHVEIAQPYVGILEQQLRSNTCDVTTMNTITAQISTALNDAQEAFHASPEGQLIPWP